MTGPGSACDLLLDLAAEAVAVGKAVLDLGLVAGAEVGVVRLAQPGVDRRRCGARVARVR